MVEKLPRGTGVCQIVSDIAERELKIKGAGGRVPFWHVTRFVFEIFCSRTVGQCTMGESSKFGLI